MPHATRPTLQTKLALAGDCIPSLTTMRLHRARARHGFWRGAAAVLILTSTTSLSLAAKPVQTAPMPPSATLEAGERSQPGLNASVPAEILRFAQAVVMYDDAKGKVFAIIDKPGARLWVFDAHGQLTDTSPVLVGQAAGDLAPADIGTRPLSKVKPHEKITPAGRFAAEAGHNIKGEDITWLDYDQALSIHRVRNVPGESRAKRLNTPGIDDNRISFGCINVPASFYDRYVKPVIGSQAAPIYILPEQRSWQEVFPQLFPESSQATTAATLPSASHVAGSSSAATTSPTP